MEVRKRIRTWGPVKMADLASGKVKPGSIPVTETELEAQIELPVALLGILESLSRLANSELRVLMTLAKLSCLFGGPVRIGQTRLAKLANIQRSTIADATRRLQDIDFVSIKRSKGGMTNTYTVNHAALANAAQASPVLNGGAPSAA